LGGTGVGKSSLLNALVGRRHDFHGEGYNDGCFKVIKKNHRNPCVVLGMLFNPIL